VNLHPEYVELACTGLFSRSEAFRRAAAESRRNILIDARRVVGRAPTILERCEFGVNVADGYLGQLPRIRLALLGHEPMIFPDRFGEIVARNRGADARVFTVAAEAIKWLVAAWDFAMPQAATGCPAAPVCARLERHEGERHEVPLLRRTRTREHLAGVRRLA
jgi:hypothetical protein